MQGRLVALDPEQTSVESLSHNLAGRSSIAFCVWCGRRPATNVTRQPSATALRTKLQARP